MRRWIPPFTLLVLLGVAVRPLWSAQFLFSYDGPLHLLRAFALDLTLRQGVVYPRWLLDLAYGYGYPIFDFYPPFAAYAVETVHLLGLGFAEAFKATFTLVIAAALFGAYALGTELFAGEKDLSAVGILTAIAYVFFPYFMVGIYTRGALAEAVAVALLPWLVWSLRRLLKRQTISPLLLVALLLAILFVAHSLTAVLAAPLLGAYVIFESFHLPAASRIKAFALAAASAFLGVGLAAFYWLPFVAELHLVKMGGGMDILADVFETNFLKLSSLVQLSWFYDYGGPPVPLGLVATAIGGLVLIGAIVAGRKLQKRSTVLFFGMVAVLGAISITEPAREVWLAFSLSSMIQSVWRVELLINLGIAVVIGSLPIVLPALNPLGRLRLRFPAARFHLAPVAVALVAIILIWTTVAGIAPAEILLPHNLFDLAHLARFEVSGASPGTTTFGEYMPITVKAADLVNFRAQKSSESNAAVPDITLLRHAGMEWLLAVSAPAPASIPLRAFFFPDWSATVDGHPARVYGSTALGLLTVDVPSGTHEVTLSTGTTIVRQLGILLSGAAALIVLGSTAYAVRRRERDAWMPLIVIAALLVVILLPALAALTASPPPLESKRVAVSPGFDLIGLSLDGAQLEAGTWTVRPPSDRIHLRAYWQVKNSGLADSPVTWRLTDDSGRVWAQRAQFPRYGTALQESWVPNEIVQDEYDLPLSAAIPPGLYNLQVSAAPQQDFVTGGLIDLKVASLPPAAAVPQPAHPVSALLGNQIRLLGYDAPPSGLPGQRYDLTLYWRAERDVLEDYTESVQLLAPDGSLAAQHDSITGEGMNPTSLWIPAEPVAERRRIELPRDLKPGNYTLIALMYNLRDMKRLSVVTDAGPSPESAVVLGQVRLSSDLPFNLFGAARLFASTP